ncbi:MAG: hypothetical protein QM533_03985 [Cytophagales bacterium]|nr:hypothetical protein [Cytophagales bacterium]
MLLDSVHSLFSEHWSWVVKSIQILAALFSLKIWWRLRTVESRYLLRTHHKKTAKNIADLAGQLRPIAANPEQHVKELFQIHAALVSDVGAVKRLKIKELNLSIQSCEKSLSFGFRWSFYWIKGQRKLMTTNQIWELHATTHSLAAEMKNVMNELNWRT